MSRQNTPKRKNTKSSPTNGGAKPREQLDPMTPAPTLVEADASRYLGMSVPWLRVRRRDKTGPAFIRTGRAIRYRVSDLEKWLVAHTVTTRDAGPGRSTGGNA
jgi:predicted DNA-binding transcriptional regulator AlpA